ncbi:MAG: hypothetical protein KF893_17680 [Caldilineaceae bacterium]|nr:hypothetical protein [Caldilineaceae bacterium]
MDKENRKNLPEEKRAARNRYDTSADNILEDEPEGRHFNENIEPRHSEQKPGTAENPNAHLGAEEVEDDEAVNAQGKYVTTAITAPQIREKASETEQETLDEIKKDMTSG